MRPVADVPEGVEAVRRAGPDGSFLFLVNHTDADVEVRVRGADLLEGAGDGGRTEIPAGAVSVLREPAATYRP